MNIFLISTYKTECGVASYTRYLATELAKTHNITILAECLPRTSQEIFKDGDINVLRLWRRSFAYDTINGLSSVIRLIKSLSKEDLPDIIHIQHEFGLYDTKDYIRLVADLNHLKIKVVTTLHTVQLLPNHMDLFKNIEYLNSEIIVHSFEAAAAIKRGHIIPHGVQERDASIIPKGGWKSPENRSKIGVVPGFISENKGTLEIIEAFALVRQRLDDVKLVIAGLCRNENYKAKIKEKINKYGLEKDLKFHEGFLHEKELKAYIENARFVVLGANGPTPYSSSGQMALAMSYFAPIIAKNTQIYRSVRAGVLYYDDKYDCAAWMEALYQKPEIGEKLLYEHYPHLDQAAWPAVAEDHLKCYAYQEPLKEVNDT